MARRKNSDKDEQLDFFDERELNSNREAIDDMSLAGKRKHHFFGKFLLLVIIGFIAYGCYYYFVQNTPKKTFTVTFDTLAKGVTEDDSPIEDISTNYKLKFNIKTENDDYRTLATIINKAAISGTIDVTNKYLQNNTILNYGSEEVFDLTTLINLDTSDTYLKLNNIYDKVIKIALDEAESDSEEDDDYFEIVTYVFKDISKALETAEYKREVVKEANEIVKKDTLVIDNNLITAIYTKLLQDSDFLFAMAKMTGVTTEDISDYLNEEISNIDIETKTLSIYSTLVKNNLRKIEYLDNGNSIIITIKDNKASFEVTESYTMILKGYLNLENEKITLNVDIIEEKTNIETTIEYSNNRSHGTLLDTKDAIDYTKISEEDQNKIMEKINNNKGINDIMNDLGVSEEDTTENK